MKQLKWQKLEYENGIELGKKTFENYVMDNREDGFEKSIRIFVCDPDYQILEQTNDDLSSSPYAFRLSSGFSENFNEIKSLKPQIIAVEFIDEVIEVDETKANPEIFDEKSENAVTDSNGDQGNEEESSEIDLKKKIKRNGLKT